MGGNSYCYLPRGIQANVSHNGKISGQKRKIAVRIEAAHAVKCLWSTPEAEAPFGCRLAMYIVVLFTSGSAAPSFLDPSNFWLKSENNVHTKTYPLICDTLTV